MSKEDMIQEITEMLDSMTATDVAQAYWCLKENCDG